MGRIEDKKQAVERFIRELEEVLPSDYEEYQSNLSKKLASERAFEKIIESVNDLAILWIKEKRLQLPSEDEKAFDILANSKLINEKLARRLKKAKGMRNILAHQYDNLDEETIFEALQKEIIIDAEEFLEAFGRRMGNM